MFDRFVLTSERNFEVTFGIFSVLVFQTSVLESYLDIYGTPNTSEVTSSFVDNQKSVLSIRITLLIILRYKMHSQICKVVTVTTNSLNLDI